MPPARDPQYGLDRGAEGGGVIFDNEEEEVANEAHIMLTQVPSVILF